MQNKYVTHFLNNTNIETGTLKIIKINYRLIKKQVKLVDYHHETSCFLTIFVRWGDV